MITQPDYLNLSPTEKLIWDSAFELAITACRYHVEPVNKGEYRDQVADAFISRIKLYKRRAEAGRPTLVPEKYSRRKVNK